MKEAMFYEKLDGMKVHCGLCRFYGVIADGKRGICGVRENHGGTLFTLVYGRRLRRTWTRSRKCASCGTLVDGVEMS